jgi:hypothetical protein
MANIEVTIFTQDGVFIPSVPSVPVVSGDTVSFSASDGGPIVLFFSPQAATILSPTPARAFALPAGGKANFTFASSEAGAYSVFFAADASSGPSDFPTQISKDLVLELGALVEPAPTFSGPHDNTTSGN